MVVLAETLVRTKGWVRHLASQVRESGPRAPGTQSLCLIEMWGTRPVQIFLHRSSNQEECLVGPMRRPDWV